MDDVNKIKFVIIGYEKTGKTLFTQYLDEGNSFLDFNNYHPTNGASYISRKYNYENIEYTLDVWDTSGEQKYRALTKFFIRDAHILLIFFNYNDRRSFEDAKQLVQFGKVESDNNKVACVLVGSKYDLELEQKTMDIVNEEEVLDFVGIYNIPYAHISIKEKYSNGVNELLNKAFKEYVKTIKNSK